MRMSWKTLPVLTAAIAVVAAPVLAVGPASAETATVGLTKWVSTPDGYGYDPAQPVRYYSGSSEQVRIPVDYTTPEREFRSSWVATVSNLNVAQPKSEADFQQQYTRILDRFEQDGLNAMIFQVRPSQDAWYPSALNPWSAFLSGKQGVDPGYDPLKWMVEQTHARGMEYHAWLNPYRVTVARLSTTAVRTALGMTAEQVAALTPAQAVTALAGAGLLSADNYAVQHPDQVLLFDGLLFLNPGEPEVRAHVVATVRELAEKYDIDGIHLDDYFYPYRTTVYFGDAGEDQATFEKYGAGYPDTAAGIAQWRRDNVTALVQGIHDELDAVNAEKHTAVQFGVSPFGIWEHKSVDPRGSNTPSGSSSTYSKAVFADTRGWVKANLIDYIVPQLYWSFDQAAAPYGELARWWNDTVAGTDVRLYIGHANYKHLSNGQTEAAWTNPDEIPNQLKFDQTLPSVSGEVFFGYNDIVPGSTAGLSGAALAAMQAKNGSIDRLFGDLLSTPVLTPADPRKADAGLAAPASVTVDASGVSWKDGSPGASRAFAVYRDGALQRVVWATGASGYSLAVTAGGTVTVAALDHAMNESARVGEEEVVPPVDPVVPPVDPVDPDPVDPVDPVVPGSGGADGSGGSGSSRVQPDATGPAALADTGSDILPGLAVAGGLLVAGAVVALGRRRHSARENSDARAI